MTCQVVIEREVTRSKGPLARTPTWGCCSDDSAFVHWTPALPTELRGIEYNSIQFNITKPSKMMIKMNQPLSLKQPQRPS